MTACPPPPGRCTSSSDDVGSSGADAGDGLLDGAGLTDDVDCSADLGAHASPEERVIVDEHDPHDGTDGRRDARSIGSRSSTSVPRPVPLRRSPCRRLARSDPRSIPRCRDGPAGRGSARTRCRGRARTTVDLVGADLDEHRDLVHAAVLGRVRRRLAHRREHERALRVVHRSSPAGRSRCGCRRALRSRGPSTSIAPASVSPIVVPPCRRAISRSSRSWRRASVSDALGSSAFRWINASVCSTESWRCAAIASRSSERIRGEPLGVTSCASRQIHGPTTRRAATTRPAGARSEPWSPPPVTDRRTARRQRRSGLLPSTAVTRAPSSSALDRTGTQPRRRRPARPPRGSCREADRAQRESAPTRSGQRPEPAPPGPACRSLGQGEPRSR